MPTQAHALSHEQLGRVRRTALLVCLWWTVMLGVIWALFVLPLGAQVSVGFAAIWLALMAAAYPVIMNVVAKRVVEHR